MFKIVDKYYISLKSSGCMMKNLNYVFYQYDDLNIKTRETPDIFIRRY